MLPLPIFTSEIVELYDKRNPSNYLKNNSQNTTLKLNPKKDRTELIITNIGLNSEIIRKNLDQRLILEIEPESKINLEATYLKSLNFIRNLQDYKVTIIPICFEPKGLLLNRNSQISNSSRTNNRNELNIRFIINVPTE